MNDSALTKFPAKVRTMIYRTAFAGSVVEITKSSPHYIPGVLQSCHQLRFEALPVFFAQAQFDVTIKIKKGGVAWKWIMSLSKQAAAAITHLELHVKTDRATGVLTIDVDAKLVQHQRSPQRFLELNIDPSNKKDPYMRIIAAIHEQGIQPAAVEWTTPKTSFLDCFGGSGLGFGGDTTEFTYNLGVAHMVEQLQLLMVFGELVEKAVARPFAMSLGETDATPATENTEAGEDAEEEGKLRREKLEEIEAMRMKIRKKVIV